MAKFQIVSQVHSPVKVPRLMYARIFILRGWGKGKGGPKICAVIILLWYARTHKNMVEDDVFWSSGQLFVFANTLSDGH